MSRRASFLAACVAAVLVLLALTASAAVPRCAEDGTRTEVSTYPAAVSGSLTYNGASGCADGETASFEIVTRSAPTATMAKLNNWNYIVAVRSTAPAVYTLDAKCGTTVVCEAEVTIAVQSS